MKKLFIEAKYNGKIILDSSVIKKLPQKIGLVSTVQFADKLNEIKKQIEKFNKKVLVGKSKQKYAGQVLGCDVSSAEKIAKEVDCFLYIGDGNFHPLEIALKTNKEVFTFNPFNKKFEKLDKKEIERIEKRKKGAYLKFLSSENIGILVSTKYGQNKINEAVKLKSKLKNKNCYILIFDTLDLNQLESFNFIDCFVNTACPRLSEDFSKAVVNIEDLESFK